MYSRLISLHHLTAAALITRDSQGAASGGLPTHSYFVIVSYLLLHTIFCRAMLCISAASASRGVSPFVTFMYYVEMSKHIVKKFSQLGSQTILVFTRTKPYGNIPTGTP